MTMGKQTKAVERKIRLWVMREERKRLERRGTERMVDEPTSFCGAPPRSKGSRTGA